MSDDPRILLTNDDGIDHSGIAAMAAGLSGVGPVRTVPPAADGSGVGRQDSYEVTVREREAGDAVEVTPCDCVCYGLGGLDAEFGAVVSGCNAGPNMGAFELGRSGTVSAAVEAASLDTPGIAVSAYDPVTGCLEEMGERDTDRRALAEVAVSVAPVTLDGGRPEVHDLAEALDAVVPEPRE